MSLAGQIALSLAAGLLAVALVHSLRGRRRPGWADAAWAVLAFAYFAAAAFELVHDAWPAREGAVIKQAVLLVIGAAGLSYFVRELIVRWRDEDKLADLYGSQQGYIARPERLSARTKALLLALLFGGVLVASSIQFIQTLFFPE
jgi:drug/metabolite transporter (DMT)-like permease